MERNERLNNIIDAVFAGLMSLYRILQNYFLTGIIVVVPIGVTLYITYQVFIFADSILGDAISRALGRQIPGIGLFSTILLFVSAGMLTQNVIGKQLMSWVDRSLQRLPLVRSLYVGIKQVSDVLFQKQSDFQRVVIIEYPKENSWVFAFVTGEFPASLTPKGLSTAGNLLTVFVPTTPNPTSGFLLILDRKKVVDVNLGVEEAIKIIISGGLVKPGTLQKYEAQRSHEDFTIPH